MRICLTTASLGLLERAAEDAWPDEACALVEGGRGEAAVAAATAAFRPNPTGAQVHFVPIALEVS